MSKIANVTEKLRICIKQLIITIYLLFKIAHISKKCRSNGYIYIFCNCCHLGRRECQIQFSKFLKGLFVSCLVKMVVAILYFTSTSKIQIQSLFKGKAYMKRIRALTDEEGHHMM